MIMNGQVNVIPITCSFTQLNVLIDSEEANSATILPATILRDDQAFSLQVLVTLGGPGAIALLPLQPTIQVEFYAKPFGPEVGTVLGEVELATEAQVFTYTPTLKMGSPTAVGLTSPGLYKIGAILRVGAPNAPALINGYLEELAIEVYTRPAADVSTAPRRAAKRK